MKTRVLHNQSLLDIALQYTGAVENAFALAVTNGLSITDELEAGESLQLMAYGIQLNKEILNYYQAKGIQPATAIGRKQEAGSQLEGVGYWAIGIDFIVQQS